jgi:hypothetical protein
MLPINPLDFAKTWYVYLLGWKVFFLTKYQYIISANGLKINNETFLQDDFSETITINIINKWRL